MAKQQTLWTPSDFFVFALVFAIAAGLLGGALIVMLGDDWKWVGFVVAGVLGFLAQIMLSIGIVAKGVQVGRRVA